MKLNQLFLFLQLTCGLTHGYNALVKVGDLLFPKNATSFTRVRRFDDKEIIYNKTAILDFIGLVERHGYPGEEHNATTPEGYHLVIHRIPYSPRKRLSNGKVIFVQHGLFGSSDSWVIRGPNEDLPFLLADAGYDVWVGNFRGNCYSRSHETLKPTDPAFWRFSYNEHGSYDLPTMIDYVLKYTGKDKLYYAGHSMGTTSLYVMLSTRPQYNNKIKLGINLAPVVLWTHNKSPLVQMIVKNAKLFRNILENKYEIGPLTMQGSRVLRDLCNDKSVSQPLCLTVIFLIFGEDKSQLNTSSLAGLLSYYPAGASVNCLKHYMQHITTKKFDAFDYGPEKNLVEYGQREPPLYDLKKVTAPIALYYSANDVFSSVQDVVDLKNTLSNVVIDELIPYKLFNHLDYVFAKDSKEMLFDPLIRQIQRY